MATLKKINQSLCFELMLMLVVILIVVLCSGSEARSAQRLVKYRSHYPNRNTLPRCGRLLKQQCYKIAPKCHTAVMKKKRSIPDSFKRVRFLRRFRRARFVSRRHKRRRYIRVSCGRCRRRCW